ncbi:MAG: hypothetical protein MZW92_10355 [Comamonadaceae bacterium]|nr:hypothetical protein [Comamonadaceae bacterium]
MTPPRTSKDTVLPGHRPGGLEAEHLLPAGHRGHHRPGRPDHLDGLRRRAAQDPGQPGARLLPAGQAGHPPRPALRALPERPRRAERHHQRRPGRGQPARRRHVHLRQRAGRRRRRSAPSPATSARRCSSTAGLDRVVCSTADGGVMVFRVEDWIRDWQEARHPRRRAPVREGQVGP